MNDANDRVDLWLDVIAELGEQMGISRQEAALRIMEEIRSAEKHLKAQEREELPADQFGDLPDHYDPRSDPDHPRWNGGAT